MAEFSLLTRSQCRLNFANRLWDRLLESWEKCKQSKATTKHFASFHTELASIEERYSTSLAKLAANNDHKRVLSEEGRYVHAAPCPYHTALACSSLAAAWSAVLKETSHR
jgi:hypothetical protein